MLNHVGTIVFHFSISITSQKSLSKFNFSSNEHTKDIRDFFSRSSFVKGVKNASDPHNIPSKRSPTNFSQSDQRKNLMFWTILSNFFFSPITLEKTSTALLDALPDVKKFFLLFSRAPTFIFFRNFHFKWYAPDSLLAPPYTYICGAGLFPFR